MPKTATTAQVAKYLEREDVKPFTAQIVVLWYSTHMETSVLAHHLHMLMEDVNEGDGSEPIYDLRDVDWEALAERFISAYAKVA